MQAANFQSLLPREPGAGCAERRAHGQFAAPRGSARQQQPCHVHARDEQHQRDRDVEQPQRRAIFPSQFVAQQSERDAPVRLVLCVRRLRLQPRGQRGDFRARLLG